MALNLFKKSKPKEEKKEEKKAETAEQKEAVVLSADAADTSLVLKGVHVTEKAGFLNGLNQYVFKVAFRSNKIEIKKAVEKMYGVKVDRVTVAVVPAKKRRLGRQEGERSGYKKAMVKLAAGHKIDVMPK